MYIRFFFPLTADTREALWGTMRSQPKRLLEKTKRVLKEKENRYVFCRFI